MPDVLVPLAQGCEELEAVTVIDLLRRAGIEVITAGLDAQPVRGNHPGTVYCLIYTFAPSPFHYRGEGVLILRIEHDLKIEAVTPADEDVHAVYEYLIGNNKDSV